MKAMKTVQLDKQQRERLKAAMSSTVDDIINLDGDYIRYKMIASVCIALHNKYGFAEKRLSQLIHELGGVATTYAEWAEDLGDDEMMYRELRSIGLEAMVDVIEETRTRRENAFADFMGRLGGTRE